MPKPVRSPEEIEEIRNRILDTATTLIYEQGFDNLSMRKIASRLGMTAANIYNYYANQDALYLSIQIKGFTLFNEYIRKVYEAYDDPHLTSVNEGGRHGMDEIMGVARGCMGASRGIRMR